MQDRSDDLTSDNLELRMRLLSHDGPPSLDQEVSVIETFKYSFNDEGNKNSRFLEVCMTSASYLDSSGENAEYLNDQRVQLEESLYAELKASVSR